jgi:hypothetical protein
MEIYDAKRKVINDFLALVDPPPLVTDSTRKLAQATVSKNPIKQKGLRYQDNRFRGRTYQQAPRKEARYENIIQRKIEENPFLLYTPRLYPGGLFLDSIISKLRIFNGKVPDFVYITVCGTTIKITLVEIECASHRVFPRNFSDTFHSDALEGLNQVRGWKTDIQNHRGGRRDILKNLLPLFSKYPITFFDKEGQLHSWVQIQIDYMLVVGRERPSDKDQAMLDQLYRSENILMMTYPMMMDAIAHETGYKNMLKRIGDHYRAFEVHQPKQILNKSDVYIPSNTPFQFDMEDDDPASIKFCGLGFTHETMEKPAIFPHPFAAREVLMRAGGVCEYPGCSNTLMGARTALTYCGILGNPGNQHWSMLAVFCQDHLPHEHETIQYTLKEHFESTLPVRGVFNPKIDVMSYVKSTLKHEDCDRFINMIALNMGISQEDCSLLAPMLKKLMALPKFMRCFFCDYAIYNHFEMTSGRSYEQDLFQASGTTLVNLGLMMAVDIGDRRHFEDVVFSEAFIKKVADLSEVISPRVFLENLCMGRLALLRHLRINTLNA